MSETRIDKSISDVAYVLDCLIALRNIQKCGCCNNCVKRKYCKFLPAPGEMVRYNCIFYEGAKNENV